VQRAKSSSKYICEQISEIHAFEKYYKFKWDLRNSYSCASFILIDDEFPGWPTHVGNLTFLNVYQFFKTNLSKKSDKNVTFDVRNQPIMKEFLHGSIETKLFYEHIYFSLTLIFLDLIIGFIFLLTTISFAPSSPDSSQHQCKGHWQDTKKFWQL
jgi:hypothetical protein